MRIGLGGGVTDCGYTCTASWGDNIGALIIRIGFWCPLYYNYNKGPPK